MIILCLSHVYNWGIINTINPIHAPVAIIYMLSMCIGCMQFKVDLRKILLLSIAPTVSIKCLIYYLVF